MHAPLYAVLVESLAAGRDDEAIMRAVDDYLAIALVVDGLLMDQVELDLVAFESATMRCLTPFEQADFRLVQQQASRWTFLGCGMADPFLLDTLGGISRAGRQAVEDLASIFS